MFEVADAVFPKMITMQTRIVFAVVDLLPKGQDCAPRTPEVRITVLVLPILTEHSQMTSRTTVTVFC